MANLLERLIARSQGLERLVRPQPAPSFGPSFHRASPPADTLQQAFANDPRSRRSVPSRSTAESEEAFDGSRDAFDTGESLGARADFETRDLGERNSPDLRPQRWSGPQLFNLSEAALPGLVDDRTVTASPQQRRSNFRPRTQPDDEISSGHQPQRGDLSQSAEAPVAPPFQAHAIRPTEPTRIGVEDLRPLAASEQSFRTGKVNTERAADVGQTIRPRLEPISPHRIPPTVPKVQETEKIVEVTIGRLEVRMSPAENQRERRPVAAPALPRLNDYLERRSRRGRS
jgi:hypothetical protein